MYVNIYIYESFKQTTHVGRGTYRFQRSWHASKQLYVCMYMYLYMGDRRRRLIGIIRRLISAEIVIVIPKTRFFVSQAWY